MNYGDIKDVPVNFCPNCGEPLTRPEPLTLEQLQGMNDYLVYLRIPSDVGADLIMSALVACNADNDEPDEVYLTNNLGGRSTYDELVEEGGIVYTSKSKQE